MKDRLRKFYHAKVSRSMRVAFRGLRDEVKAARISRAAQSTFETIADSSGLRLHLGCGSIIKPGWVNIDLNLGSRADQSRLAPDTLFVNYDLRRGLPLAAGSCAIIYSAHFFEHLDYSHALGLLRECYRVLEPGGMWRAALPNFRRMLSSYLNRDLAYFDLVDIFKVMADLEPETMTLVDHVNDGVYQNGEHKWIMDPEKMLKLMGHIGFSSVREQPFDPLFDEDLELRRRYSFYIEAIK